MTAYAPEAPWKPLTKYPEYKNWLKEVFMPVGDQPSLQTSSSPETLSIYLAGSWSRREELRGYRDLLQRLGFTVTSGWLDEADAPHSVYTPDQAQEHVDNARRDIYDIERSNLVVCFNNDPLQPQPGGGRHFECGFAYALGVPIVYVGGREHIFHYLPSATVLPTVIDLLGWLLAYPHTSEIEERIAARGTWG